ncbi:hypothetical protein KTI80_18860, partial [Acinetobacter pittii]|nr:hypothetical protein [Acinetobacter pittii]
MATTTHSSIYISRPSNYEGDGTDDKEEFIETCNIRFKDMFKDQKSISTLMCAEKTGGFNLVNYRHSSGVYHEQ